MRLRDQERERSYVITSDKIVLIVRKDAMSSVTDWPLSD